MDVILLLQFISIIIVISKILLLQCTLHHLNWYLSCRVNNSTILKHVFTLFSFLESSYLNAKWGTPVLSMNYFLKWGSLIECFLLITLNNKSVVILYSFSTLSIIEFTNSLPLLLHLIARTWKINLDFKMKTSSTNFSNPIVNSSFVDRGDSSSPCSTRKFNLSNYLAMSILNSSAFSFYKK